MMQVKNRKPDRTWLIFCLAFLFMGVGWYFESDIWHYDREVIPAYSLSLGETCEADIKTCKIVTNKPIGYRPETSRDEVVSLDYAQDNQIGLYRNCMIWDAYNWECEGGRIGMRLGVMTRNDFETKQDIYYVPKLAWKMAKLNILPLDTVRRTPIPKPSRGA
jgi:hypothetical protein